MRHSSFALLLLLFGCANVPPPSAPQTKPASENAAPSSTSSAEDAPQDTLEGRDVSAEFVRLSWFDAFAFAKERTTWLDAVEEPKTIEEAKARLCVESSGDAAAPPAPALCDGPVWRITFDHLHYSDRTLVLLPLGDEVVVYDAGMIGGGLCWGSQNTSLLSLEISYETPTLALTLRDESYEFNPETNECSTVSKTTTEIRYDIASGRGFSRELPSALSTEP